MMHILQAERRVEAKFREELRVRDAKIKEFKYALENRGYQIKREDDRKVTEEVWVHAINRKSILFVTL